jgi:hypothetical protein
MDIKRVYNTALAQAATGIKMSPRNNFDSIIGYLASLKLQNKVTGRTVIDGVTVNAWLEKCWNALEVYDLLLGDDFGRVLD